jgi:hypothetical protein
VTIRGKYAVDRYVKILTSSLSKSLAAINVGAVMMETLEKLSWNKVLAQRWKLPLPPMPKRRLVCLPHIRSNPYPI